MDWDKVEELRDNMRQRTQRVDEILEALGLPIEDREIVDRRTERALNAILDLYGRGYDHG